MVRGVCVVLMGWLVAASALAGLEWGAPFGDHAVLQRDRPVNVWGWADPGQSVQVSLDQHTANATADGNGRWNVTLPALPAGGPFTLKASSGGQSITAQDVLVGEVWLCSGQSNMGWKVKDTDDAKEAASDGNRPTLRIMTVPERALPKEDEKYPGLQWVVGKPAEVPQFSATAYYFATALQDALKVPVGVIVSARGGSAIHPWISRPGMDAHPQTQYLTAQKPVRDKANMWDPAAYYHGMIRPLAPMTLAGVVWYQGESNAAKAYVYRFFLEALVSDWRKAFDDDTLPFAIVQLPSYLHPRAVSDEPLSWAELRESQAHAADTLDHVGLIVTYDTGNPVNIHPGDKKPVGQRIARWAAQNLSRKPGIEGTSPTLKDADFNNNAVTLTFNNAAGGLTTRDGQPPQGFLVSNDGKAWNWAYGEIKGDQIIVKHASKPTMIRYAWGEDVRWANLTSKAGLPVAPFRTDDLPGRTVNER